MEVLSFDFLPGGSLCISLATRSNQPVLFKDEFVITAIKWNPIFP